MVRTVDKADAMLTLSFQARCIKSGAIYHLLTEIVLTQLGLPLTSSLLLEYSPEYLNEQSSTR